MGSHMRLVGFDKLPLKSKSGIFQLKKSQFYDGVLMYGRDADIEPGRSIFHEAMFQKKDIVTIQVPEEEFTSDGFLSDKLSLMSNFTKWAISKKNPISRFPYFKEAVSEFLQRIDGVTKKSKFVYWDVFAANYADSSDQSKITRFLQDTADFYELPRKDKRPSVKQAKVALTGSVFETKGSQIVMQDWVEEELRDNESFRTTIFYGDI